jgi:hypothetical protein
VTPPLPEHSDDLHMRMVLNRRLDNLYYPKLKSSLGSTPGGGRAIPAAAAFVIPPGDRSAI